MEAQIKEYRSTGSIKSMQEQKLKELLAYLDKCSPFYKQLFAENAIDIHRIHTLTDLALLPTTVKEDIQQYNEAFLCVPKIRSLNMRLPPEHWEAR